MDTITDTNKTTAAQVSHLARRAGLRISALLQVDDVTLQVHRKTGRAFRNTLIRYNRGTDLYDITSYYYANTLAEPKVRTIEGVYAENLVDVI